MARPSPQTDRVVALIELIALRPAEGVTLAEVTRGLGVNKSTCHSMLSALTSAGWLLRDPVRKRYCLGPGLVAVGRVANDGFPALAFARSAMADLSAAAGANCLAFTITRDQLTVVDEVRHPRAPVGGLRVGSTVPFRPPFGAAAVASDDTDRWLAQAPAAHRESYAAALASVRARGYAVELAPEPMEQLRRLASRLGLPELLERLAEELTGDDHYLVGDLEPDREYDATSINIAVPGPGGQPVLLLSLSCLPAPLPGARVVELGNQLLEVAGRLSAALAGTSRTARAS
ncbi:helix-turn-helix domain-containing protein [Frankia sp. CNm7]|uniref:Helix-turn-helix domain-containing protein n=1 Tax=Frankia nepalensis TaxID=1836974 RepID=A0A937RJA3_9ACTN|nr:helix-turn-helix domain-containing protein [Frankia nepalensis]MBL7500874.1 helix-turn-helix domain-containing protein [Frankia nepalensis]MBL7509240.1 helix-turn-helix domain-containing protein [Frankia nepalensis]MBL7517301.1 helix-turn-helix domain-containing protein [Frankia nepalensis]MBL7626996.1 helix-turn-helix domain-containing protein [Frankia nepalensis]